MSDSDDEEAFASADEHQEGKARGDTKDDQKPKDDSPGDDSSAGAVAGEYVKDTVKESRAQLKGAKKKGKKGGRKNVVDAKKADAVKSGPRTKVSEPEKGKAEKSESPKKQTMNVETDSAKKDDLKPVQKDSSDADKKETCSEDANTQIEDSLAKEIATSVPKAVVYKTPEKRDSDADVPSSTKPDLEQGGTERTSATEDPARSSPTQVESPNSQDIPRSVDDVKEPEPDKEESAKEAGSWGWGGWGSSILSAASSSVTTFTSQVGEGFTTIVESMESSLGALPPEEIARLNQEESQLKEKEASRHQSGEKTEQMSTGASTGEQKNEKAGGERSEEPPTGDVSSQSGGASGWLSGMSSLTHKIQDKGKSLVSGSLDAVEAMAVGGINVLENIGKKTIDVLTEHDPGFKATKDMFHPGRKTNLSSLLREAKEKQEEEAVLKEEEDEARKHNYGAVFDDYQGLAHLEALEILSNQSEIKVQSLLSALSKENIAAIKPQLLEIKGIFELDDSDFEERQEHDFSKLITDHLSHLHLGTTPDKLNNVQRKTRQWIIDFYAETAEGAEKTVVEPKEICHAAIAAMAELTAKSVEQFHKAGELVLMQKDADTSCVQRSKSLASLTHVLCTEISILSTKFSQCLHKLSEDIEDKSVITPLVTNVFLEASNSSTYIQDGFQLLLPVLQHAFIQNSTLLQS